MNALLLKDTSLMRESLRGFCLMAVLPTALFAQVPSAPDLQALKQAAAAQGAASPSASEPVASPLGGAPASAAVLPGPEGTARPDDARLDAEIRAMKLRERGPQRFASDLFTLRQVGTAATDGGIAEDYVLGTGDQLAVNAFGSATFDLPAQVDGRGEILIPKVGTVRVGGLSLAAAKRAVQAVVNRNFSRTSVDLQVVKLREVRVFVMGEVYKPGSYLVPSLSSLVNVLSLAGGPTAIGSYRDIRVMRGGKAVFHLDLYPYRAEGLGNVNFSLASGDTLFVPLAQDQVMLEGAFQRVVSQPPDTHSERVQEALDQDPLQAERHRLSKEIKSLEAQLALPVAVPGGRSAAMPSLVDKHQLEDRLNLLKGQLADLSHIAPEDHRLRIDPATGLPFPAEDPLTPHWLQQWDQQGITPVMEFEMRPGETAADALRFAGGFAPEAGPGTLTLRRRTADGVITGEDVPLDRVASVVLQRGDILSALPQRERAGAVVQVVGWARVPGYFARTPGLKVGDLLKRDSQLLPDTYRARGEVVRTLPDGTSQYFPFDVDKALNGDPGQNLLLADRDRVELYRVEDMRLPKTVTILGPLARPGLYAFHEGMRASDLIFRAGVPLKSANRLQAELAHTQNGRPSEVVHLDLEKLLSTATSSPVTLVDDTVNPKLRPDDQISLFEKPDFKVHRTVTILGQVARPGAYVLDSENETLSQILKRAGGLTSEAMPEAAVFLRRLGTADQSLQAAAVGSGVSASDPTAKGINSILERLSETKRQPTTGSLLPTPLLHGLMAGNLNRMVVNFKAALGGHASDDVELQDGDEIIVPRATDSAYVVGETASPFANYKVDKGMKVRDLLKLAGGTTRNADTWNIRLLKADGRIIDSWVMRQPVGPGDTVLVPQRFRRDSSWQEDLAALTPIAVMLNVLKL
ncbi:MAG TPA: SLBB domain-containing protein [Holophagaceae bacterium]